MKRPSFQFYPADWRKDPALSACSLAARGLWIELMCVAHEGDNYGHLSINGKPMTPAQVARMVGESPAVAAKLLKELEDAGVFSRDEQGCIFSRRMVKDEHVRNVRADAGRLGGNPNLLKQKVKQNEKQNLTPSSSSSSSSSDNPPAPDGGDVPPGFAEFWKTWPPNDRKQAKGKCLAVWKKAGAERDAAAVLAHVERLKDSESWKKQGGQFVPAPLVYLGQRRWEGADDDAAEGAGAGVGVHFV